MKLIALIIFLIPLVGLADNIQNDPRRPFDRKRNPEYNAIGIVKSDIGRGSGWMVNNCLVMTNKHVIGKNQKIVGKKVTFYVGQGTESTNYEYEVKGVVVASGNFKNHNFINEYTDYNDRMKRTISEEDLNYQDWAIIKLENSIGKKVGVIPFAQYSVEDAATCVSLEIAGFPGEKDIDMLYWERCTTYHLDTSSPDTFDTSCSVTPGDSGSPLLCRETNNKLYAIGIASRDKSTNEEDRNSPLFSTYIHPTGSKALNFTLDWVNIKSAYQEFKNSCE